MIRRRKRKFVLFIVELAILALVIGALVYYQRISNMITVQDVDGSKIAVNEVSEETVVEFSGSKTIAIFGLDNRDLGEYDYGNTDVIMVMNVDNDSEDISMISVYRDTYVNIAPAGETAKYDKANAAYAYGGVSQAINMLNQNLDIDVDNYVCVDFQAVSEAIDILGGVEIEIESDAELKYLNEYIEATNDILGTRSPTIDSIGLQTLDGTQAVAYSRIRYTTGGDYKRAQRQRRVLSEMFSQAKDASLSQLTELIDAVFPDISTDMSQRELLSMAQAVLNYDLDESQGFPFDRSDTVLDNGLDIVVPCTLSSNVIKLHELMFGTEDYQPSVQVEIESEYIVERTGMTEASAFEDQFSYADSYDYDASEDEDIYDPETEDFLNDEDEAGYSVDSSDLNLGTGTN